MLKNVVLDTMLRCDLRCAHCLRGDPEKRPDFPLDLAERLLAKARSFGARHTDADLEPLLERYFSTAQP